MNRILVIGGTGMLGEPVAHSLKAAGFTVRVFSRDLEKARRQLDDNFEFIQGDVEDPASLNEALQNCTGVHINLRGGQTAAMLDRIEHQGTANVARAAASIGLQRISFLSYAAELKNYVKVPYARAKFLGEKAIINSGVPYMIFRSTHFMESLKFYFRNQQAVIIGNQPKRFHWCAASDYVRMVARAYQNPDIKDKRFYIFGPEGLTMREALTAYCNIKKPDTNISSMPFWMPRLLGTLTFNPEMKFVSNLMRFFSEAGEQGDPTEANRLLGTPKTTLENWSRSSKIL